MMMKSKPTFIQSMSFAIKGLKIALEEKHVRLDLFIAVVVSAAGFYFQITTTEWLICLLLFGLVIGLEVMNTAIERFVDMVQPNWDEKAGRVKDLSAGAVLCVSIFAAIGGILIFGKYVLALFR
jgi:diacylglycerol kinase